MKHRIVTAAQMKEIERAGDAHGLPYLQMMENAGLTAYAELQKQFPHPGSLLVVCGKGNNGGDGFVIARAAAKDGWNVTVLLAEGEPKTADAIRNFERLHTIYSEVGFLRVSYFILCTRSSRTFSALYQSSGCTQKTGSCKRLTTGRSLFISYSFVIHRPCRLQ